MMSASISPELVPCGGEEPIAIGEAKSVFDKDAQVQGFNRVRAVQSGTPLERCEMTCFSWGRARRQV